MASVGLVLAFGLEVLLYVAVCVLAWDFWVGKLPLGIMVVLVVTTFVALRVALVLVEFLCSYLWGSRKDSGDRLGFWGSVRLVATEIVCFLIMVGLLLPFSRRLITFHRGSVSMSPQLPVLLIHGYASNAGIWAPMINFLYRRGLTKLFTLDFDPKYGELNDYAQQVAVRVNRICNTTGAPKIILVAHSMGGLIARAYVERFGGAARVAKLISIGTPHHGTVTARLAPGLNARQMRIGSDWLQELNREENVPHPILHVSIYSAHDNVVVPHISAELGKARNVKLVGKGHFSLLFSKEVGQLVYREVIAA
ncbi:MAG: alpha/beta fold hydrolase [Candidatus Hydrogenedentes bacterium]|nr:alpha/beta fold hydrolase [Candidatus Hydrogenedentota bacterium]